MSLIYGEYLANVHFGDIPHTFIPHFTLHSAEKKIRIEFSANYPLTTFRIPRSAKYPFPKRNSFCALYEYTKSQSTVKLKSRVNLAVATD